MPLRWSGTTARIRHFAAPLLGVWMAACAPSPPPPDLSALSQTLVGLPGHAQQGFRLETPSGAPFTPADFVGRWTVVGLGYTSCPDVCPGTFFGVGQALDALGDTGWQAVFVAVDPERDRPTLDAWVAHFHPDLIGVTGSTAQLRRAAQELGGSFDVRRVGGEVQVDHSTSLFVVDPTGRAVAAHLRPSDGALLASELAALRAAWTPPARWQEGWARPPLPGSGVSAGYGTLHNHGDLDRTVVAAHSPDAAKVLLHETVRDGDQAWMQPTTVVVPAGGTVVFAPGGRHLMFDGVQADAEAIDVRFRFDDGKEVWTRLVVRPTPPS